jgi:tRNA nucleotidyltransferase (CCA-adding enzyme)
MQIYMVGGAVRDALLGLPVKDHDWVVVGATPEHMVQAGFLPVGKDFPVFLHPVTKEEVALARTERKTAPGYHGFAFHAAADVTLEDDLSRRDLTINSIAVEAINMPAAAKNGTQIDWKVPLPLVVSQLVDPHGGQRDLQAKVLRHVSSAFAEDPVRILRLARFAARFADFTVAPETMTLMRQMVASGEVDALVPERVWQEIAKGLMEQRPSRMFEVLRECGALARLLPELDKLWGVPQRAEYHPEIDTGVHVMMVLDMSAQLGCSLPIRYACLCHDFGKGTTPADVLPRHIGHEDRSARLLQEASTRLRVPTECRQLAEVVAREHGNIHRSADFGAAAVVRLLQRCDAFRKPQRFADVLIACECDARGRLGFADAAYPQRAALSQALQAALSIATHLIADEAMNTPAMAKNEANLDGLRAKTPQNLPKPIGKDIGELILQARVAAVAALPAFQQRPAAD